MRPRTLSGPLQQQALAQQLEFCIVNARIARAKIDNNGWVAQLAEQWTENPRVGGSIPPPAILLRGQSWLDPQISLVA